MEIALICLVAYLASVGMAVHVYFIIFAYLRHRDVRGDRGCKHNKGRMFRHKDGFGDNTDYIQVIEHLGKSVLHCRDGTTKDVSDTFPLEKCLRFVRTHNWIEL